MTSTSAQTSAHSSHEDAEVVRAAIMRISRRLRHEASTSDVTPSQRSVLIALESGGPASPHQLAAREGVRPPWMTRTLTALREIGMVEVARTPLDGRKLIVTLTAQGRELLAETRWLRSEWLAQELEALSVEQRRTLIDAAGILRSLADKADAAE